MRMNPLKKEALGFKHPFYLGEACAHGSHRTMERLWRGAGRTVSVRLRLYNERGLEEVVKKRSCSTV